MIFFFRLKGGEEGYHAFYLDHHVEANYLKQNNASNFATNCSERKFCFLSKTFISYKYHSKNC